MPWRAERTRVVECHADVEVPEIGPPNPLGDMKHLRMRNDANPALVVVTDGIDDERIAIPLADRMSDPARIRILRMRAAIHEDLPEAAGIFWRLRITEASSPGSSPAVLNDAPSARRTSSCRVCPAAIATSCRANGSYAQHGIVIEMSYEPAGIGARR